MSIIVKLKRCLILLPYIKLKLFNKNKPYQSVIFILLLCWALHSLLNLPPTIFASNYATTLYDREGRLMNGQVSEDGQWRFQNAKVVPQKFKTALKMYEDEWFNYHLGINPISFARATYQNIKAKRIVRGGSTITMQVARMVEPKDRTIWNKLKEIFLASRIEYTFSKDAILELYANHAPFGGNIVGIEAASWRYFGRDSKDLSWAEASLLAVLPNSPSLIRLDRNRARLLKKRNALLTKLYKKGFFDDKLEYQLSLDEPLPTQIYNIPSNAAHLFATLKKEYAGKRIESTINGQLQNDISNIIERESSILAIRGIRNCASIVIDNTTGSVIAYIGNSNRDALTKNVDIIQAPRSSGSILKPFLYDAALNSGLILPTTLLLDVPTYYKNFSPNNFNKSFSGATKANEALTRSLNIPAVRLLSEYTPNRFYNLLHQLGFTSINRSVDNYGLSLILGGAEVTLWDVCQGYYQLANSASSYRGSDTIAPMKQHSISATPLDRNEWIPSEIGEISLASNYLILNELTNVSRPPEEQGWEDFASNRKIGWKTGTSFGFKDAWAVGVTPEYTVGVWVGNANGDGNNQIIGGLAAAPIMFQIYRLLPSTSWFQTPFEALNEYSVCRQSGYKKGAYCDSNAMDIIYSTPKGELTATCPYHKPIALTADGKYRTNSNSTSVWNMQIENFFVLPANIEYYYRSSHPEYVTIPPVSPNTEDLMEKQMQILYPEEGAEIFLPKGFGGEKEKLVIKIAHRNKSKKIFWHLNNQYLTTTEQIHALPISPSIGNHTLTATDENGNRAIRRFKIVDNK